MAFRIEATIGALLILAGGAAGGFAGQSGQAKPPAPPVFQVRHRHLPGGAEGALRVSDEGIAFEESGRFTSHSRQWRFEDIEQLTLSPESLRILTYENRGWKLGDRQFVFDRLPEDSVRQLYELFSGRLDQRFVAALADDQVKPRWKIPVRLTRWRGGEQGSLIAGADRLVFDTDAPEQSRTWRLSDIDNISSSGPFDLTVTTFERDGANYAARRDFHFQLKRPMTEADYDALWGDVNRAKALRSLSSSNSQGEKQ